MVTGVPWRSTQLSVVQILTVRPRTIPRPIAPTSKVPSTQAQAETRDVVVAVGVGRELEQPDDPDEDRQPQR